MKLGAVFTLCIAVLTAGCTSSGEISLEEMKLGKEALDTGKFKEAIGHYRKAIEHRSHNWMAYAECGDAHFFLKEYDNAVGCYDNATTILHSMIRQYLKRGLNENLSKPLVIGDVRRYQKMQADVLHKRGISLMHMKKYADAVVSFRACLNAHKAHLHGWWSLAKVYDENLKKPKAALNAYSWFLSQYLSAPPADRQSYSASIKRVAYAKKRKQELTRQFNRDRLPKKEKPRISELICATADDELRAEIRKLLAAETEKAGLKIEVKNSRIRIEGKREALEPLHAAILKNFPDRLDRIELEIR